MLRQIEHAAAAQVIPHRLTLQRSTMVNGIHRNLQHHLSNRSATGFSYSAETAHIIKVYLVAFFNNTDAPVQQQMAESQFIRTAMAFDAEHRALDWAHWCSDEAETALGENGQSVLFHVTRLLLREKSTLFSNWNKIAKRDTDLLARWEVRYIHGDGVERLFVARRNHPSGLSDSDSREEWGILLYRDRSHITKTKNSYSTSYAQQVYPQLRQLDAASQNGEPFSNWQRERP